MRWELGPSDMSGCGPHINSLAFAFNRWCRNCTYQVFRPLAIEIVFNSFLASHDGWMRLYILLNARRFELQLRAMWQIVAEGHRSATSWVLRWSSAVLKTQLLVEGNITVWGGRLHPRCVL